MHTASRNESQGNTDVTVRLYTSADREFVLGLAPRLLIGAAPWINQENMLEAVRGWITASVTDHGNTSMVFIAESTRGARLGFASVTRAQHFTGVPQAYIGELAVDEAVEGRGAGKALVRACEQWAREQGYEQVVLETGFANERGRHFYERLGFKEESVKLVRLLQ